MLLCLQQGLVEAEKGKRSLEVSPVVPRESSEVVSKGVWLSPTDLYFATSPFSRPRFPPRQHPSPPHTPLAKAEQTLALVGGCGPCPDSLHLGWAFTSS